MARILLSQPDATAENVTHVPISAFAPTLNRITIVILFLYIIESTFFVWRRTKSSLT